MVTVQFTNIQARTCVHTCMQTPTNPDVCKHTLTHTHTDILYTHTVKHKNTNQAMKNISIIWPVILKCPYFRWNAPNKALFYICMSSKGLNLKVAKSTEKEKKTFFHDTVKVSLLWSIAHFPLTNKITIKEE